MHDTVSLCAICSRKFVCQAYQYILCYFCVCLWHDPRSCMSQRQQATLKQPSCLDKEVLLPKGTARQGLIQPHISLSIAGFGTAGFRTEQRAAARKDGSKRSSSPFGATASRYMNPRASLKPEAEPDRVFRARSVPRGMSPQRSRVADYIRVGSPIQRGSSTQVPHSCPALYDAWIQLCCKSLAA